MLISLVAWLGGGVPQGVKEKEKKNEKKRKREKMEKETKNRGERLTH